MNWVDGAITAVVLSSTFSGFKHGFLMQCSIFVGAVAGLIVSGSLYENLAGNLELLIEDPTAADFTAFLAVMFGMILIGYLFGLLLRGLTKVLMLGWLDRFGGMILGCLTALLVLILSLSSIAVFPAVEWLAKDVESSLLANNLLGSVSLIDQLLPSEFQDPQAQLTSWREAISQLSTKDTNK